MKDEQKENFIAIIVILCVVLALGWWIYSALQPEPIEQDETRRTIPIGTSPWLGEDTAPILVMEFSDFECPICARFALEEFPTIKEELIDTGEIIYVYKYYPLEAIHSKARRAAYASACAASQGMFWEYHDLLYERQNELEIGHLEEYAEMVGLDMDSFTTCFLNEERATDVEADIFAGRQAGVTGTPTFFFNGRRHTGYLTSEQFIQEIEKERTQ